MKTVETVSIPAGLITGLKSGANERRFA